MQNFEIGCIYLYLQNSSSLVVNENLRNFESKFETELKPIEPLSHLHISFQSNPQKCGAFRTGVAGAAARH